MSSPDEYLVNHYSALGNDWRNANLYNLVAKLIAGKSVLDIGCGTGSFLKSLKDKEVTGVEPSAGMRELARKINPEIKILEKAEGRYDTVTMLDVLEHIEEDGRQVREVHSLLNSQGQFVVVVPAHPILYGERDKNMGHFRRYTKRSLTKVLEQNGFRVKKIRFWNALGFVPYFISERVFKKPLQVQSRKSGSKFLDIWFKYVENNFDFGFGLSIICVAEKHV